MPGNTVNARYNDRVAYLREALRGGSVGNVATWNIPKKSGYIGRVMQDLASGVEFNVANRSCLRCAVSSS